MFRPRLNELRLKWRLKPEGPLLVKQGEDAADMLPASPIAKPGQSFAALVEQEVQGIKTRGDAATKKREGEKAALAEQHGDPRLLRDKLTVDMRFVRRPDGQVYLPGSSLKGVLRSYCEQFARTFLPVNERVCDIFAEDQLSQRTRSCTKILEELPAEERYGSACRICQVFGCGGLASRIAVSDAYLVDAGKAGMGMRSGVGIDRQRGAAASGALFFYEVLEQGIFETTITLENFELWQVGLLAFAFDEWERGRLWLGYGTRRGLGRMVGTVQEAELTYFGAAQPVDKCLLRGMASLTAERGIAYRHTLVAEPEEASLPWARRASSGVRQSWVVRTNSQAEVADMQALWQAGAAAWEVLAPLEEVQ